MLDKILSGEQTEIVIEQIHEYLSGLGDNVRAGKIPLEQYIVVKVSRSSITARQLEADVLRRSVSARTPKTTPTPSLCRMSKLPCA